jgi:hypothetical protein
MERLNNKVAITVCSARGKRGVIARLFVKKGEAENQVHGGN